MEYVAYIENTTNGDISNLRVSNHAEYPRNIVTANYCIIRCLISKSNTVIYWYCRNV